MVKRKNYLRGRRLYILCLCPKEVRSLISCHLALLRTLGLVTSHLERICLDGRRGSVWIVTIHIHIGLVILVVDVIIRHPVTSLIKRKPHVISLIILHFEGSWRSTVIVYKIHSDLISCTETVGSHLCCRLLEDVTMD